MNEAANESPTDQARLRLLKTEVTAFEFTLQRLNII